MELVTGGVPTNAAFYVSPVAYAANCDRGWRITPQDIIDALDELEDSQPLLTTEHNIYWMLARELRSRTWARDIAGSYSLIGHANQLVAERMDGVKPDSIYHAELEPVITWEDAKELAELCALDNPLFDDTTYSNLQWDILIDYIKAHGLTLDDLDNLEVEDDGSVYNLN